MSSHLPSFQIYPGAKQFSKCTFCASGSARDNGSGADGPIAEGIGMAGMGERVCGAGGTFRAENVPDGFTLFVTIPISAEAAGNG